MIHHRTHLAMTTPLSRQHSPIRALAVIRDLETMGILSADDAERARDKVGSYPAARAAVGRGNHA